MRIILILVFLLTLSFGEFKISKDKELKPFFNGYDGVFILYDEKQDSYIFYNQKDTEIRVTPASTFKIYNALIGLDSKVVKDGNSEFKWDKKEREYLIWNDDHTLDSAIKYSVVWYFQRLASMVGEAKMSEYIKKIDYGNGDISGGIEKFWLNSSLKISPFEQLELLKKFYNYDLPFSKRDINIVKKILVISDKDGVKLSAKTGSSENLGWFIGYLEREARVYFFVTNIKGNGADGIKAKKITKDILCFLNLMM